MRRPVTVAGACLHVVLLGLCLPLRDSRADSRTDETGGEPPVAVSAGALLAEARARLPQERLAIEGDITVRRRRGIVVRELSFVVDLDWGGQPPRARVVIRDAFGSPVATAAAKTSAWRSNCRLNTPKSHKHNTAVAEIASKMVSGDEMSNHATDSRNTEMISVIKPTKNNTI